MSDNLWGAFFTIWWFASGEEVMYTSKQSSLANTLYEWFSAKVLKETENYYD